MSLPWCRSFSISFAADTRKPTRASTDDYPANPFVAPQRSSRSLRSRRLCLPELCVSVETLRRTSMIDSTNSGSVSPVVSYRQPAVQFVRSVTWDAAVLVLLFFCAAGNSGYGRILKVCAAHVEIRIGAVTRRQLRQLQPSLKSWSGICASFLKCMPRRLN